MQINFTIFIQAGNFLLVYALLRRYLFRPTIRILENEKTYKIEMQEQALAQRASLEEIDHKQEQLKHTYQEKIAQRIPHLELIYDGKKSKISGIQLISISLTMQDKLIKEATHIITDRVRNVVH